MATRQASRVGALLCRSYAARLLKHAFTCMYNAEASARRISPQQQPPVTTGEAGRAAHMPTKPPKAALAQVFQQLYSGDNHWPTRSTACRGGTARINSVGVNCRSGRRLFTAGPPSNVV
jgi:hypothetical protein